MEEGFVRSPAYTSVEPETAAMPTRRSTLQGRPWLCAVVHFPMTLVAEMYRFRIRIGRGFSRLTSHTVGFAIYEIKERVLMAADYVNDWLHSRQRLWFRPKTVSSGDPV